MATRTDVLGRPYSLHLKEERVMQRYLVVADVAIGARELKDFVRSRNGNERSTFHLVVRTIPDRGRLTWDEGEAHLVARRRLAHGLAWMREVDPRADGEVGDVDPTLAIEDALRDRKYDVIVLSIRRPQRRRTIMATRARRAFRLPVVDLLEAPPMIPARPESTQIMSQTA
jgi:hypothetical protein